MKLKNNRILCMCLSGIGDTLTFTPFLRILKQQRPDLKIDVVVMFKASEGLLIHNKDIDHIYFIDFLNQSKLKSLKAVFHLRKNRYSTVISAYPSNRAEYSIIQFLLGSNRIGHKYLHYNWINLNWLKNFLITETNTDHVVEQNLKMLKFFDIEIPQELPKLVFPIEPEDENKADQWIKKHIGSNRDFIGIHAGSALLKNHINRRWAPEKFAEISQKIIDQQKATVLIFGGPEENPLKEQIEKLCNRPGNFFCVNGTSINVSAAILKKCQAMITNDSSLMHISSAMQIPVIAIFAYTNPKWVHPWKTSYKIIRKDLNCSPCFFYSPKPASCHANLDYQCAKSITVDEVYQGFLALFQS